MMLKLNLQAVLSAVPALVKQQPLHLILKLQRVHLHLDFICITEQALIIYR